MSLTVGKRYAFFIGRNDSPEYNYAISTASGYLSELQNQLVYNSKNDANDQQFSKIQAYIQFIGEVASQAQKNEIDFIQRINQLYDKDYLGVELKQHLDTLIQEINNGDVDYIKFISVFTDFIHLQDEHYKERDQIYESNAEIITKNYNNIKKMAEFSPFWDQIYNRINYEYDHNYGKYKLLAAKYLTTPIRQMINNQPVQKEFTTSVTTQISNRFKSMLTNLSNSEEFRELIIKQITNSGLDANQILNKVIALALQEVASLSYKELSSEMGNGKELAERFYQKLKNGYEQAMQEINQNVIDNVIGLLKQNKDKSISLEEIALTSGYNITNMFKQLDQQSQEKIFALNPLLKQLYDEGKALESKTKKNQFKTALINTIKETFSKHGFIRPTDSKELHQAVNNFISQHSDILGTSGLHQQIKQAFNVKTDGGSIGEYLALHVPDIMNSIQAGGTDIKFKTDMGVTITFNEKLNFNFSDKKQEEQLIKQIENFIPDLLQEMKKQNLAKKNKAEQTDADVAINSYLQIMENIKNLINELKTTDKNNEERKKQLLTQLSDFFSESISVKDYDFYNNELGVHGGSLGGSSTPINVINNISKMYELGGIDAIDKDLLMFGAINCANGMIANGIEEDLATYLLGGAAIIMFDEGFTDITKFFEKIKADFGFAMKPLHLYRVQGKMIPASYIYAAIYNNLCTIYPTLKQEMSFSTLNSSKCKVIIINTASPADISTEGTIQEQWDKTAENVQKRVKITFSFMAGLLDIFHAIPEAFNNIK